MGITSEEVEVAAQNRSEWRQSVAQCIHCGLNHGQGQGLVIDKGRVDSTSGLVMLR